MEGIKGFLHKIIHCVYPLESNWQGDSIGSHNDML